MEDSNKEEQNYKCENMKRIKKIISITVLSMHQGQYRPYRHYAQYYRKIA